MRAFGKCDNRIRVPGAPQGRGDACDRFGVAVIHAYIRRMETIALYIHWPFCLSKCPYCDFNSHVRDEIPQARFARALRQELASEATRIGPRRLTSIFFGGGTPSLMAPETVAALIDDASSLFAAADDIEITLEANPTSIERDRLRAFRAAGVNRLSVGVQAFDDAALQLLGRTHSVSDARAALDVGRALFDRMSLDLIYARPGQTPDAWRAELAQGFAIGCEHLSLYQLTIEPGTPFEARHRRGELVLPEDDDGARLYEATQEETARHAMTAYEVSNYARPGEEGRHNLTYWRYRDYAGIGPGAHGRLTVGGRRIATRRHRAPEMWASLVERDGHGSRGETLIEPAEQGREMLMMGLRLQDGVRESDLRDRTALSFGEALDQRGLDLLLTERFVTLEDGILAATEAGRLRLDSVLGLLLR
jgi:oxygen-independent coproporphyrinogen-3 oxidase